jgi:hypothetical protein
LRLDITSLLTCIAHSGGGELGILLTGEADILPKEDSSETESTSDGELLKLLSNKKFLKK